MKSFQEILASHSYDARNAFEAVNPSDYGQIQGGNRAAHVYGMINVVQQQTEQSKQYMQEAHEASRDSRVFIKETQLRNDYKMWGDEEWNQEISDRITAQAERSVDAEYQQFILKLEESEQSLVRTIKDQYHVNEREIDEEVLFQGNMQANEQ